MTNNIFWAGTKVAKSSNNAFSGVGYDASVTQEIRKADTAAHVGKASTATKHAKGQDTMPALNLRGSTPRKRGA